MRRRISWIAAIVLTVTFVLAGCGSKNADSIVKDLDKVVSKMESYQGSGTMTLHTGQQPLTYKVEVWYQKPQYYRISLTNEKRDITQIVLRNDEGVFVLTPQLNKSYRFQSDWPENQGQVYLYQTLVQSILYDNSRQFTTDKSDYVFDVMAGNYQNGSFARQKIYLKQDDYAPSKVEVSDTNGNLMVSVNFDSFEFGKKFEKSAFDMNQNMGTPNAKPSDKPAETASPEGATASPSEDPNASASPGEEPNATASPEASASPEDEPQSEGTTSEEPQQSIPVVEPSLDSLPEGVEQIDTKDVAIGENLGVMLRYSGTYDFSILEIASKDRAATMMDGILLDLGFTVGHLTTGDTKTLTWTYDGVEYRIASANLPEDDMIRIAQSMEDSSGK